MTVPLEFFSMLYSLHFLHEAEINNLIFFKVDTYIVAKIEPLGSLCIFVW